MGSIAQVAFSDREPYRSNGSRDPNPVIDTSLMELYGLRRYSEPFGDLLAMETIPDQAQYFDFSAGESFSLVLGVAHATVSFTPWRSDL